MRILWVGPWGSGSAVHQATVRALQSLGHQVEVFDQRADHHPLLIRMPRFLTLRLRWRFPAMEQANRRVMNRRLSSLVLSLRPDLFLISKGDGITIETLEALRGEGIATANWFPDDWQQWRWVQQIVEYYDAFFPFDSSMAQALRELGHRHVYHLPFAYDPTLHRPLALSPEDQRRYGAEICFVGSVYPERLETLSVLTDFDLAIWGPPAWRKTHLRDFYRGYISNREPMVKLYNACTIALNIHWRSKGHGANYRTFEIAGCSGALQIVDDRRDIHTLFAVGQEVVIYHGLDDLREKVAWYLQHADEARTIAYRARERACREHTFQKRMAQLIRFITEGTGQ
jgi:spore maturation protein CgeB